MHRIFLKILKFSLWKSLEDRYKMETKYHEFVLELYSLNDAIIQYFWQLYNISGISAQNSDITPIQIHMDLKRIKSTHGFVKVIVIYRNLHKCVRENLVTPFWVWRHNLFTSRNHKTMRWFL